MWFRDVAGTNVHVDYPLKLTQDANGAFAFRQQCLRGSPLFGHRLDQGVFSDRRRHDVQTAFGNQGNTHNYSFTVELHTTFIYHGRRVLPFSAVTTTCSSSSTRSSQINLGGIHGPGNGRRAAIDSLGLTKEQEYPLDFFYAERHVTGSNLLVTTSLGLKPAIVN